MKNIGLIVVVSLISAFFSVTMYRFFAPPKEVIIKEGSNARYTNYTDKILSDQNRTYTSAAPTSFTEAAKAVTPAVVNIRASAGGDFDFWGSGSYSGSSGSGVIVSPDGYIVTNNHVIEEGKEIEVTLNDKRKFEAELVGIDNSTDLALLKIKDDNLPHLIFANSDNVLVGEWVLAVGNPFNLESTVTAGIVSAKGRNINILEDAYSIESFIQTDAAVNPGNSGGALVNTNGELVGINTAIITRSGRYEGYSFAIPANLARKVVRDLKDFGVVQRGILGVGIEDVSDELSKSLDMANAEGIYINKVHRKSAAEEAGLKKGDVIISINRNKTISVPELQALVAQFRPGNTITVTYIRDGKKLSTDVTLKNKSNTTTLIRDDKILESIGFELKDLSRDEIRSVGVNGVKVKSVIRGSTIENTNMDPGFIITKINGKKVSTIDDVIEELESADEMIVLEGIYENFPGEYYYKFPI